MTPEEFVTSSGGWNHTVPPEQALLHGITITEEESLALDEWWISIRRREVS